MESQSQSLGDTDAADVTTPTTGAAPLLGLWRALCGAVLLALAWGLLQLALRLMRHAFVAPPHSQVLARLALYMVGALGLLWLGVVALGCILVALFALFLALTRRGWH